MKISLLSALQCQMLALTWSSSTHSLPVQAANIISLIGLMSDVTGVALALLLSTTPERVQDRETSTSRRLNKIPWVVSFVGAACFVVAIHICTWTMQSHLAFVILVLTTLLLTSATIYVMIKCKDVVIKCPA